MLKQLDMWLFTLKRAEDAEYQRFKKRQSFQLMPMEEPFEENRYLYRVKSFFIVIIDTGKVYLHHIHVSAVLLELHLHKRDPFDRLSGKSQVHLPLQEAVIDVEGG